MYVHVAHYIQSKNYIFSKFPINYGVVHRGLLFKKSKIETNHTYYYAAFL